MKYLKIYEEFEPSSVEDDIKDIFIELTDNYFDVRLKDWSNTMGGYGDINNLNMISISKSKQLSDPLMPVHNFEIDSNIIDSILRLIDYLRSNNLYLNDITIAKLRPFHRRWILDDINVTDVTKEGFFIKKSIKNKNNKLFTDPVYEIIIKYSNKSL
jgi:hypothetical protein